MTYPANLMAQLDTRQLETAARDTDNDLALEILRRVEAADDNATEREREAFDSGYPAGFEAGSAAAFAEAKRALEREINDLDDGFDPESRVSFKELDAAWLKFKG